VDKIDRYHHATHLHHFSKGYNVILHNNAHIGFKDDEAIDKAVDNHIQNKVGVVLVHGAVHTFFKTPKHSWDRLCGCHSISHGKRAPIRVKIVDKEHAITKAMGVDGWKTKEGELYHTKLNEGTSNLANGTTLKGKKHTQSCIFTHQLEGNNVVGITLGRHNSTME